MIPYGVVFPGTSILQQDTHKTEIKSAAPIVIILLRFSLFHYEAVLPGTISTQHGATFLLSIGAHLLAPIHSCFKRFLKTPISVHYHRSFLKTDYKSCFIQSSESNS